MLEVKAEETKKNLYVNSQVSCAHMYELNAVQSSKLSLSPPGMLSSHSSQRGQGRWRQDDAIHCLLFNTLQAS